MAKKKATSKSTLRPYRHTFWFNFGVTGKPTPHKVPVRLAKQSVEIEMTLADVEKAIREGGIGNSLLCAGSQCLRRYQRGFSHPVYPPADWLDSIVFIPDKISKKSQLPISCVAYRHHDDIAAVLDLSPAKLRKRLEAGPIKIKLHPVTRSKNHAPPPGFVRRFTGERSGQIHDVIVVGDAPRASERPGLPLPAAIGEVVEGASMPARGAKHRFARAHYGIALHRS